MGKFPNVYDLGNGKYKIVAVYQAERRDRRIRAASITEAAKEQRKFQQQFEQLVATGLDADETAPLLWRFCAAKNPEGDVHEHGPYHLHILNRNRIAESTYRNRMYTLATLIDTELSDGRRLGDYGLDEIGKVQFLEYQNARSGEELEASTINTETSVLRGIMRLAVIQNVPGAKLLAKSMVADLDETSEEATPWTTPQIAALLEACWRRSRRLHGIVLAIANTGMRRGEAIHLQWSGVDLDSMTITLRPSKWWRPKNKQSRRIPISPTLAEYLRILPRLSSFVFLSRKAEPYAYWPQKQFDEAREAAQLNGGPHRLRHTFASHFLANWSSVDRHGDPMMELARVLGHSHVQMTKTYTHFLPGALDNARGLVDFGGAAPAETKARGAWAAAGVKRRRKS